MKKRVIALAAIAIAVLVGLSAFGIYTYEKASIEYIMKFDGKKISTEEYKLFLDFEQSEDDTKASALDTLTKQLVVEKALSMNGIAANETELEEIAQSVESVKANYREYELEMPNVSDERLSEIFSVNVLYSQLYNIYAKDYVFDSDDFISVFEDYRENGKQYYIDTQMKYIITETEEDALTARERILLGENVDDVIIEYSTAYSEDYGIDKISLSQIQLTDEQIAEIMSLEIGEVSEVIDMSGMYVVFWIDDIIIPTDEELYEDVKSAYETSKKDEMTSDELQRLRYESNIEINNKAYDSVA